MKYTAKRFTVPAVGKAPPDCGHGWIGRNGRCVLCGEDIARAVLEPMQREVMDNLAEREGLKAFLRNHLP